MSLASSMLAFEGGQVYITGGRGPVGPTGPAGSSYVYRVCGEDIIVNRLVYIDNGLVYHSDKDTYSKAESIFGLAVQSVSSGGSIQILTFGERIDGSFGYPNNGALFLGSNGQLTTTPPTSGTLVHVGAITSPTSIIINIQEPLILA